MATTDLATSQPGSHDLECAAKPNIFSSSIYDTNALPSGNFGTPNSNCSASSSPRNTTMALEQYRLQLYNYALNIERLRCPQYMSSAGSLAPWTQPYGPHSTGTSRMTTLSTISLFPQAQRVFQPEEPKPQHSYIGLIAMAILSSNDQKLVLSDIYQYILDNYPYFRTRGPGWRNSIRHNLSLNDCFIKSGRSANGKGHYWAIHPANMDDFRKGDFRRRKAQRKVRKHMGLSVDDASTDSPSPPPLDLTTPPPGQQPTMQLASLNYPYHHHHYIGQFFGRSVVAASLPQNTLQREQPQQNEQHIPRRLEPQGQQSQHQQIAYINSTTTTTIANLYSQTRKRQFDVASLLAPDVQIVDIVEDKAAELTLSDTPSSHTTTQTQHTVIRKVKVQKQQTIHREVVVDLEESNGRDADVDADADIDVVDASDAEDHRRWWSHTGRSSSFDVEAEDQPNFSESPSATYALSVCSSNDSNSLGECPIVIASEKISACSTIPLRVPKAQEEPNHFDPHILSRYYGTYMAAAAAHRAYVEPIETNSTTPPAKMELAAKNAYSN